VAEPACAGGGLQTAEARPEDDDPRLHRSIVSPSGLKPRRHGNVRVLRLPRTGPARGSATSADLRSGSARRKGSAGRSRRSPS